MTIDDLAALMARALNELKDDLLGEINGLRTELTSEIRQSEKRLGSRIDGITLELASQRHDGLELKGRVEKLETNVFGSIQAA